MNEEEIYKVVKLIHSADEYGLAAEVFIDSLIKLKENPSLPILEVVQEAYNEWMK